jgi:hypothetical protein
MDKATTSAILGTILGLAAGVGGMLAFGPPRDDGRAEELTQQAATRDAELVNKEKEIDRLAAELDDANFKAEIAKKLADELELKTSAKLEAEDRANSLQEELDRLKGGTAEDTRQKDARIEALEKILADHGITEHLSDAEIAQRMAKFEGAFNTALTGKDKVAAMEALWRVQGLGPRAYDKAIELWQQVANDFGMGDKFGQGPNTLGLTFQDYTALIREWGIIEKGLTDPKIDMTFRLNAIYSAPWWSSEDAGMRANLVGNILLSSKGYESQAATEALKDIESPASVRYLSDYVAQNRDNPENRIRALTTLAGKDTPDAWSAIEDAAKNDIDESVRKFAQQLLDGRNVSVAGIRITFVDANSQGALAGIKIGDILTHYNGERVKTLGEVNTAKGKVGEGQSVKVVVRRGADDLTLTLGPGMIGINGVSVAPKE